MQWDLFTGRNGETGPLNNESGVWRLLPELPPWRRHFGGKAKPVFVTTPDLVEAVNAALHLRRPLLLTGPPGSGKSTLVDLIASELGIEPTLRWHITSKSTLGDGLFMYDALGRLQAIEEEKSKISREEKRLSVEDYITLGPLGTALASPDRPRAVLVDEIDKSDLDLPSDMLNVLEDGYFRIPPLIREAAGRTTQVHGSDGSIYEVTGGEVQTQHFPVIVMTSNGERAFPPPFLRRCIRFEMPPLTREMVSAIVSEHLGPPASDAEQKLISDFAADVLQGQNIAIDQLLSLVYLVTGEATPGSEARDRLRTLLLRPLSS
jgi:MoxR-like ATPase